MVNTLYSPQLAIDALAHACSTGRLGLLALTKSLCNKGSVHPDLFRRILKNHPDLKIDGDPSFQSIHEFVTQFVLPNGRCICVMNEEELQHLTDIPVCTQHREANIPTLGGVIKGLKRIREFQRGATHRIYVTVGPSGGFVLDENNDITYCGIVEDSSRKPTGKTAIGDIYATFLLALETIAKYIRPYSIPAWDVIKAAAAGADSGVYDGFGNLAVNKVNNFLGEKKRRLVSLGNLDAFPCDSWKQVELPGMHACDWDSLTRINYMEKDSENYIPGTLQEVIGRAFLRL